MLFFDVLPLGPSPTTAGSGGRQRQQAVAAAAEAAAAAAAGKQGGGGARRRRLARATQARMFHCVLRMRRMFLECPIHYIKQLTAMQALSSLFTILRGSPIGNLDVTGQ